MNKIDIYSKSRCKLCDEAKALVQHVNTEYRFQIEEHVLTPSDKDFERYKYSFPVLVASNGKSISGNVTEEQVRNLFISLTPPPRIFYVAKFLEALAIVAVMFGLMHGMQGDMWTDLYFFIGGIVVFAGGRMLEKWEARKRTAGKTSP